MYVTVELTEMYDIFCLLSAHVLKCYLAALEQDRVERGFYHCRLDYWSNEIC